MKIKRKKQMLHIKNTEERKNTILNRNRENGENRFAYLVNAPMIILSLIHIQMCIRDRQNRELWGNDISIFQMFHACEDERFIAEVLIGFVLSCGHKKCISLSLIHI